MIGNIIGCKTGEILWMMKKIVFMLVFKLTLF